MPRAPLIPLTILVVVHVVVLFAGFFAPYGFDQQKRHLAFAPPTRLHFIDSNGEVHPWPFVYALRAGANGSYEEDRSQAFPVRFLVSGESYRFAGVWRSDFHLFGVKEPAAIFLMGTDDYGRDQFSRFVWGAQASLLAGTTAAALALSIGAIMGAISGYYGKFTDEILMAAAELFLSLPWLYLLLGVRAMLPLDLEPGDAFFLIVTLLGAIGWARPARLVRGVVPSAKQREFVLAARGFGASDFYILRRHVLPQTSGVLLTQAALLVPQYIVAEVTMSFLGLGLNEPAASWGLLLANLQEYHAFSSHWWLWFPVILITPVFFAYYAVAASLGGLSGANDR